MNLSFSVSPYQMKSNLLPVEADRLLFKANLLAITLATCLVASAAPPKMLLQGKAQSDPGAASGSRTSFAIMRLPDGAFAFYDRNSPFAGPLTLPDTDGTKHTLLPWLPTQIVNSKAIRESDVLANT